MADLPKSLNSKYSVEATFRNDSDRHVRLYWLDFKGDLVMYSPDFKPRTKLKIFTFVTHPWVARDNSSGQWMWLNGQQVYVTPRPDGTEQEGDREVNLENNDPEPVGKLEIIIRIPVYRLEDLCIGFLKKKLKTSELTGLELNSYLLNKLSYNPKLCSRVYQANKGVVDIE